MGRKKRFTKGINMIKSLLLLTAFIILVASIKRPLSVNDITKLNKTYCKDICK